MPEVINDFPDDLLEEIFCVFRREMEQVVEDEFEYNTNLDDSYMWGRTRRAPQKSPWAHLIVISHVCKRWRNLALARPFLWSYLHVRGTEANYVMLNQMLQRSGATSPLSVTITRGPHWSALPRISDALRVLFDHAARIISLSVCMPPAYTDYFRPFASTPFPCLQTLRLDSLRAPADGPEFWLPADIPARLRALDLRCAQVFWLPRVEGFTRLVLDRTPFPSVPDLLPILRSSPYLNKLVLVDRSGEHLLDEDALQGAEPVVLRSLRQLVIGAKHCAYALLPLFLIPSEANVTLTFYEISMPRPSLESIFMSIVSSCPPLAALAEKMVAAHLTLSSSTITARYREPRFIPIARLDATSPASEQLHVEYEILKSGGSFPYPYFCEGLLAVPLPALTTLTINTRLQPTGRQLELDHAHWDWLFGEIPGLQFLTLHIRPRNTVPICYALSVLNDSRAVEGFGGYEVPCLPVLVHLTIVWWKESPLTADLRYVEHCCVSRAAAGARLKRLTTNVPFPETILHVLTDAVDEILVCDEIP